MNQKFKIGDIAEIVKIKTPLPIRYFKVGDWVKIYSYVSDGRFPYEVRKYRGKIFGCFCANELKLIKRGKK